MATLNVSGRWCVYISSGISSFGVIINPLHSDVLQHNSITGCPGKKSGVLVINIYSLL
jgi:hypothetical protein